MLVLCWAQASCVIRQRQCKVSPPLHMPLTACIHTFGEEADRVTPNVSRAEQPGGSAFLHTAWGTAQGWIQLHVEKGQKEAAQLLPTMSLGAPSSCRPFPKTLIPDKTKRIHQTSAPPPTEHLQIPTNTSSPRSFLSPTGNCLNTRWDDQWYVGWPALSPVPQRASSSLSWGTGQTHPKIMVLFRRLQPSLKTVLS